MAREGDHRLVVQPPRQHAAIVSETIKRKRGASVWLAAPAGNAIELQRSNAVFAAARLPKIGTGKRRVCGFGRFPSIGFCLECGLSLVRDRLAFIGWSPCAEVVVE